MSMRLHARWLLVPALGCGCAAAEGPAPAAAPRAAQHAPKAATITSAPRTEQSNPPAPAADADAGQPSEAAPSDPFAGTLFPPPDFAPPHERSAKKGDGVWQSLGDTQANERAAIEPRVLYRTTVQPHEVSKYVTVTVAAIDLKHTSLHWVAGTDDPGVSALPTAHAPGLVPPADHDALLAVFNGGFKPEHGGWGMMVDGHALVPPRDEGCTIVLTPDDRVEIGSWSAVAERTKDARAYRQTPPCLLENGELNPGLAAGNARAWAGQNAHRKTRRRSAIGIDATGRVLLFGVGVEAEPKLLAEAMKHAGAIHAAQLDINWNWTRFLLFGTIDGQLQVTSTLIPQMVHRKRGYVEHTQPRDFFYLKRKPMK